MSTLDASLLAAWEVANSVGGDSVTFKQRATTTYNVATGANSDAEVSTGVTGVLSAVSKAQAAIFDAAGETVELFVQVKRADLPQGPAVEDIVTIDGTDHRVVTVTNFSWGVSECGLKGVV